MGMFLAFLTARAGAAHSCPITRVRLLQASPLVLWAVTIGDVIGGRCLRRFPVALQIVSKWISSYLVAF